RSAPFQSFRIFFRTLSDHFHDIRDGQAQLHHAELPALARLHRPGGVDMSQFATIPMSAAQPTRQASVANRNVLIATVMLAAGVVLIGSQLIFASNHSDAVDAAASTAAFGIIAP